MKPKARQIHVQRRDSGDVGPGRVLPSDGVPPENMFDAADDGFGDASFLADQDQKPKPVQMDRKNDAEIKAIMAEGFTGRQLRLARRVAQKRGLKASSDYDAIRQLRAVGIDPFSRTNLVAIVPQETPPAVVDPIQSEAPAPQAAPAQLDEAARAQAIHRIQRDIARRRRFKMAMLSLRLLLFVALPTALAGYYFHAVATPMFATNSEFVIQQADAGSSSGGGLGGMFSGGAMSAQQDSISVQSYLLSRDALARLENDLGFREHFTGSSVDFLQRLTPESSNEDVYKLYKRKVVIGYDPTEGLIKMEVIAADPAVSEAFSRALIGYAEEQVDQLTARLRDDQMQGAMGSFGDAEARMLEAQQRVVNLQEQLGVVSADAELNSRMSQINAIETELRDARFRLETLLSNSRPNQAQVENLERIISLRETEINGLRGSLTDGVEGSASLARISAELGVAQMDLSTRQAILQQAAQQLETARIEANRQVRYLSTSVPPRAPDEATYPRAFENTVLAFVVFSGIYLMMSLTASILREQVSA